MGMDLVRRFMGDPQNLDPRIWIIYNPPKRLGGWGQATCTACLKMCIMRTERRALDFEKGDAYEGKGVGPCCSSMWDQTFCPGPSPAAE